MSSGLVSFGMGELSLTLSLSSPGFNGFSRLYYTVVSLHGLTIMVIENTNIHEWNEVKELSWVGNQISDGGEYDLICSLHFQRCCASVSEHEVTTGHGQRAGQRAYRNGREGCMATFCRLVLHAAPPTSSYSNGLKQSSHAASQPENHSLSYWFSLSK